MEEGSQILDEDQDQNEGQLDLVALTADLVSAYVSNNRVAPGDMPALLSSVHAAVAALGRAPAAVDVGPEKPTPSQIRKSITPDALISFIDGKRYKTLKRHLTKHGLTMDEYRERYGLPRDYPSTAASYSEQRSALAKSLGLGNQRRNAAAKAAEVADTIAEAPKARGRKKIAGQAEKPINSRKPKKPTSAAAAE